MSVRLNALQVPRSIQTISNVSQSAPASWPPTFAGGGKDAFQSTIAPNEKIFFTGNGLGSHAGFPGRSLGLTIEEASKTNISSTDFVEMLKLYRYLTEQAGQRPSSNFESEFKSILDSRRRDPKLLSEIIILRNREKRIVGFFSVFQDPEKRDELYLARAYLAPNYRGHKITEWFLNKALTRARELGITQVNLHASALSEPIVKKYGFKKGSREKDGYLQMTLAL